jgi:hypothetical protein
MSTILDTEKNVADSNVASVSSDHEPLPPIDKAVEKRLVWKQDLLLMPALGASNLRERETDTKKKKARLNTINS